jgi:uncharacterized protein YbjT (DUF2867 family)
VQSGVRRLVLLSGRGDEEALLSEQALQYSGAGWTILRSSWFYQNPSEDYFLLEGDRSARHVFAIAWRFVNVRRRDDSKGGWTET